MLFKTQAEYKTYIRNFIFGVEDSLVSTVGLLSGIAVTDVSVRTIVLTGVVLIFVEAFSMGVGSYISEHSTADNTDSNNVGHRASIIAGVIMLISYLIAGLIPLAPYFFASRTSALWLSIGFSLAALFGLGALSAVMLKDKIWFSGIRMLTLGGMAIAIGVIAGKLIENMG